MKNKQPSCLKGDFAKLVNALRKHINAPKKNIYDYDFSLDEKHIGFDENLIQIWPKSPTQHINQPYPYIEVDISGYLIDQFFPKGDDGE